ncbi:hypothetical protein CERSUDRAFT_62787 [Gelatoporia subvermispora B]|uniref:Sucraseferredoxin-like protein n=1 Tax=Ceriporiopsis subvermispora (strain B) TaxID=914234 RepID=M2R8R6_CERS8|nr:hypothetical protein CERSUDRAFT_62787 [Gelatoporia subvermispora B]
MSSLRKLKALVLGHNTDMDQTTTELQAAAIPVSTVDCRSCANPCDEGSTWIWKRRCLALSSHITGRPQVVISTGKSDWERDVTEVPGTLAAYLLAARGEAPKPSSPTASTVGSAKTVPGVFNPAESSKVSVLNASHHTICDDIKRETVLVFPDYKVVTEVERSLDGARTLWKSHVDPSLGRTGAGLEGSGLRSYVLPYACVIMLCSHKKRDNRCAIAAPKLENALTHALEREEWEVHTQVDDPTLAGGPLEELQGSDEERDAELLRRLRTLDVKQSSHKRALIVRVSHIGGHKFAGNVIINTPQGVSVWYGRVTPHEVPSIVKETIIGGKVLPALLRGGLNLSKPRGTDLHDW